MASILGHFCTGFSKDMGNSTGKMAASIEDTTKEEFEKVMENFIMELAKVLVEESGEKESWKDKESIKNQEEQQIE